MFIWKLFSDKNKSSQNVPKSVLHRFMGISNIPQCFWFNVGENAIFPIRVNRGNEMIFEQCESALIIRAKFVNMHKIRGIFWQNISFKKILNICKLYFLEVSFLFFCFIFNLVFCLLFALFHTSTVSSTRIRNLEWMPISADL